MGVTQIQDIVYPSSIVAPNQLIPLSITTPPLSGSAYYKAEINRKFGGYSHTVYGMVMEFSLPITGTYNVKVYASNSCGWSQDYPLVFLCMEDGGMFAAYPNPASETLTIESKNEYIIDKGQTSNELSNIISYKFFDPNSGQIVLEGNLSTTKTEIDISKLSKGKYVLKFQIDNQKEETHHIIID